MLSPVTATPKLFIGVDIHKKSWSVHMRTDISDHNSFVMRPSAEDLASYIFKHFSDHEVSITY